MALLLVASLVWILVIGFVLVLCRSAQHADELMEKDIASESAHSNVPARRFRSTA